MKVIVELSLQGDDAITALTNRLLSQINVNDGGNFNIFLVSGGEGQEPVPPQPDHEFLRRCLRGARRLFNEPCPPGGSSQGVPPAPPGERSDTRWMK